LIRTRQGIEKKGTAFVSLVSVFCKFVGAPARMPNQQTGETIRVPAKKTIASAQARELKEAVGSKPYGRFSAVFWGKGALKVRPFLLGREKLYGTGY